MNVPKASTTEDLITDVYDIAESLIRLNLDRDIIVDNYPKWERQRKTTIFVNEKLYKELNDIYKNCSIGRSVGTGVSILGGITAVTGFFLSFSDSTRSVGQELTKYGSAVGTIGGAASITACVAEGWLSNGILDEVKTALRKDQQLTQELFHSLQRSEKLDSLFKKVFGTSILSESVQDFFTVVHQIQVICEEGAHTYKDISNILSSSIEGFSSDPIFKSRNIIINLEKLGGKVKQLLIEFCENPRVRDAILKLDRSFKRFPAAFEFLKLGLLIMRNMKRLLTNGIFLSLVSTISSTLAGSVSALNRGIFQGIIIAIDIYTIISTADDIKKGKSKYSKMLEDVNEVLSLELSDMNRAYLSIVKELK